MNRRDLFKGVAGVAGGVVAEKALPKDIEKFDVPVLTPERRVIRAGTTAMPFSAAIAFTADAYYGRRQWE